MSKTIRDVTIAKKNVPSILEISDPKVKFNGFNQATHGLQARRAGVGVLCADHMFPPCQG